VIEPGVVLIAIGGNALVHEGESGALCRQQERSAAFARQVVELVEAGWRVLVTHGNGPQVGFILRRGELVAPEAVVEGLPELPLWLAVADSQGGIGHLLCLAIDDALIAHDRPERAVAVLTHVEVDADDPAFGCPTKPIGGVLTADSARQRVAEEGWSVVETAAGVFRRVVASPVPTAILEAAQVRTLTHAGAVVIAAGGGGIPVVRENGQWTAVDAVVDKDRSSALLAIESRVDTMVLVTGIDEVCVDFRLPTQRALHDVTAEEMRAHLAAGQFPAGSMGPKVESALRFLDGGGRRSIITSLERLPDALADKAGTHISGRTDPERAQ
jgi:carbamate kinase